MPRRKPSPNRFGIRTTARRGRRGRPSRLASLTLVQIQAELDRRQAAIPRLMAQRSELETALAGINQELQSLGATADGAHRLPSRRGPGRPPGSGKGGRRRAKNKLSLVEALQQALKGRTLSIADAVEAVEKLGYKSKSKSFRVIINQALLANPRLFKKEARGVYSGK